MKPTMSLPSLRAWLQSTAAERLSVREAVLAANPDFAPSSCDELIPAFTHLHSGLRFRLFLGEHLHVGLDARVLEARRAEQHPPEQDWELLEAMLPRRAARRPAVLIGDTLLEAHWLKLGFGRSTLDRTERLATLAQWALRLPSEAELDLPAAYGAFGASGPIASLCRDAWHPTLEGAPDGAAAWGETFETERVRVNGSSADEVGRRRASSTAPWVPVRPVDAVTTFDEQPLELDEAVRARAEDLRTSAVTVDATAYTLQALRARFQLRPAWVGSLGPPATVVAAVLTGARLAFHHDPRDGIWSSHDTLFAREGQLLHSHRRECHDVLNPWDDSEDFEDRPLTRKEAERLLSASRDAAIER